MQGISFITGDFKLLEVFVTLPAIRTGFTEECKRSRISLTAASRELKSLTYGSAVGITLKPKVNDGNRWRDDQSN